MLIVHTCNIMGASSSSSAPPKNPCEVVIVGGGYGGIQVAMQLDSYCRVTLIDPKDAFHHNMAGLRCVVEPSFIKKTLIPYEGALKHGSFVKDRVVSCNISRTTVTLASGTEISYDYLVFACGSSVPFPGETSRIVILFKGKILVDLWGVRATTTVLYSLKQFTLTGKNLRTHR